MLKNIFACRQISASKLIISLAVFWMAFANFSFFAELLKVYPLTAQNFVFLASVAIGFTGVFVLALTLLCWRLTIKPILLLLIITTAFAAYFMDTYHILIDDEMILNVLSTDVNEASDLLSLKLLVYVVLLGVLPAIFVWRAQITFHPFKKELFAKAKVIGATLLVILVLYFISSANFSSFFREHKPVRYYSNPANYTFALGRHIRNYYRGSNQPITPLGEDAKITKISKHRKLMIMVVGETARADHFSLNGYAKKTNPMLEKANIINFKHFRSCGTSTAISVPCMFSNLTEAEFSSNKAKNTENALDVLNRAGVNVLWRDNNSSSKGVADRLEAQDYRTKKTNTICDVECRDEGMLVGLQDYINSKKQGDIIIVLHQMGNHGPAYYKRYPKAFEKFTPVCRTNELSHCSSEELNNAYDNAVLYTDYFLAKTIDFLKKNDKNFATSMFYLSDHGESLGEYGMYLHGMPNMVAPETQRHVPAVMWIGKNFEGASFAALKAKENKPYSQDNIFHTLLGIMNVDTKVYDPKLDILK